VAQIFTVRSNGMARLILSLIAIGIVALAATAYIRARTTPQTDADRIVHQPVPFSHQHHVGGLGIHCQYCHTSVERAAYAGIPPTETCMSCHSQMWTSAPILEPVRQSLLQDEPIRWNRVHNLPDYVYFKHNAHIANGVGCETCHGNMADMPLVRKVNSLNMGWCLDCHRDPAPHLRPRHAIYEIGWEPPEGQSRREFGEKMIHEYLVRDVGMIECNTCHR
jgi:hypothetical protein